MIWKSAHTYYACPALLIHIHVWNVVKTYIPILRKILRNIQKKGKTNIAALTHLPTKAYDFPSVFIWSPAGASNIEQFSQLIASITLHCDAAGPSAEDLAVGHILQISSTLYADAWRLLKLTWLSNKSQGPWLMTKNPINHSSQSIH